MRDELTDHEWTAIKPFLPNKPRGAVSRRPMLILTLILPNRA
jgi:transposase